MAEKTETISQETNDILMNHVILPRFLPQEKPKFAHEKILIAEFLKCIENTSEHLPLKTIEMFDRLKQVNEEYTRDIVTEKIIELRPGDTFAMFVRRQNYTIMFHVPADSCLDNEDPDDVIVATFPGYLHPKEIYNCDSDIEYTYPADAYKVKFSDMLRSDEFATQLCLLNEELPIDAKSRNFVSKWLVTVLLDEMSTTAATKNFPTITKKIRDECLGERKKDFFRRSSFYMCVKVMLQHNLTMQLGAENGKFLYKIVILKFIIQMCDIYKSSDCDEFNVDLLSQLIAKIARRIDKLLHRKPLTMNGQIENLLKETVAEAKETIHAIRERIDEQIEDIQEQEIKHAELEPLRDLNFQSDICHRMPKLMQYLFERNEMMAQHEAQSRHQVRSVRRYYNKERRPGIETIAQVADDVEDRGIYWTEFEKMVIYDMTLQDNHYSETDLREWCVNYTKHASATYNGDQLKLSRMLLIHLKLIAILDRKATLAYPLLRRYRCGIDSNLINSLLLPQRYDMKEAHQLERYFRCRNENAAHPGLIEEKSITPHSFSVEFAKQNDEMSELRDRILRWDADRIEKLRDEWRRGREKVKLLRETAHQLEHTYFENHFGERHHCKRCKHCTLLREADGIRLQEYEHLLPREEFEQFAVVFELKIPKMIACMRDILYGFNKLIAAGAADELKIKGNWVECNELVQFNDSSSQFVTLGSTKRRRREYFHVNEPFKQLIVHNSFNCVFHVFNEAIPAALANNAAKVMCTFKTSGEYSGLQWTLISTNHTQNEVLSRQSECPQNLTLAEFKNFGSLRADGPRLQLRKLYAMIETESLSFEKESVLCLIMQTLWECGVSGTAKATRESHNDFSDPKFCTAMIKLLEKFVDQQKDNWMHPFKVLIATLIAMRAFEINECESVAHKIIDLLKVIREIVIDWSKKIQEIINGEQHTNESSVRDLRLKLMYVAITGALTLFVNPKHKHFNVIFSNDPNATPKLPALWLHFIVVLKTHLTLYEQNEDELPTTLRMFVHLMQINGVQLEGTLKALVNENLVEVFAVIKSFWSPTEELSCRSIAFDKDYTHVFVIRAIVSSGIEQTVEVDIITGKFMVDGKPMSCLPTDITQDEMYQRVFGNATFEVQTTARNHFSTVRRHNDVSYDFRRYENYFIITERKAHGNDKELIPFRLFGGDFAHLLVANYNHWWDKYNNRIEFRPRAFGQRNFTHDNRIDYYLDLATNRLIQTNTNREMFDIKSDGYRKIIKQLKRLEHKKHIHVLLQDPQVAIVELPRMKLKFKLDCTNPSTEYELQSCEFSGMFVDRNQNVGTLFGLNYGLVLESRGDRATAKSQMLLIPHGQVMSYLTDDHVSVDIEILSSIKNPPFYQYQVDDFCQQLKAINGSHAAWFYLAYLHAVTSHGEIEPLIGMSGTERALQILQSAFAWSAAPYEPEAMNLLYCIAKLSPIRRLNGFSQSVGWPEDIPSRSAQDSFVFVVKKLIEDSQRLCGLHLSGSSPTFRIKTELSLSERNYHRSLALQPNLRVSPAFIEPKQLETSMPEIVPLAISANTQYISYLYHNHRYKVPTGLDLKTFLTTKRRVLKGQEGGKSVPNILFHTEYEDLANMWIGLYNMARHEQLNQEELTLIFTLFSHKKMPVDPILALQAVSMKPETFAGIDPPEIDAFEIASGTYDSEKVFSLLKRHYMTPLYDENFENQQDTIITEMMNTLTEAVTQQWPCASVDLQKLWTFEANTFHFGLFAANLDLNERLKTWYHNHLLENFIEDVENALKMLPEQVFSYVRPELGPFVTLAEQKWPKHSIDIDQKVKHRLHEMHELVAEARSVWRGEASETLRSSQAWFEIVKSVFHNAETKHMIEAGLLERTVPSLMLPKILDDDIDGDLKALIGAWAITIAREQRQKRIEAYSQRPDHQVAMEKETDNQPHVNWKPYERPEWLLFEIEQNLTIRRIQIEIAERMIEPPKKDGSDAKHSVMQLNMGEGKTAVIVPILAAVLANGEQACQITVLKSLFSRNLKFLRQYLGGLLNRRIYIFPCRRDKPINLFIEQMMEIYEECKVKRGVILTLPEYRLSMQLKMYELAQKGDIETAKRFLDAHKWINSNVRNILDESDAILQANYQLIYTVGNQLDADGGTQRWAVTQAVLKRIPYHMKDLYRTFGEKKIEFDEKSAKNGRSDIFTPCRILDETIFEHLKAAIIADFLGGRLGFGFQDTCDATKEWLKDIISNKEIDRNTFQMIERFTPNEQNVIMILSGLLRFEVLKLALTRRWRVNYGVDPKGQRKMAIPFKAKDVAAEMTEFGHPDVAICFTQMSYYYSGLTDKQLHQVFTILENEPNPAAEYDNWIKTIPRRLVNISIQTYKGINLDDSNQRDRLLFPLLRHNMYVIDFWLSNLVFPYEAKIFEKKLMCTAWDLCSDQFQHFITGFSGTNDTKDILPLPIIQNDLEELENTNEEVRQVLLQPENQSNESLPPNVSGMYILEQLKDQKIPVLLDSGALMLELTNKEVAIEWLKMSSESNFDAAVYFDSRDVLQTIDRNGTVAEFDCSVYRENLKRCLVYLDDVHTRGTDLKFPPGWKACVTLSGDITRDKTVQSCMRMRQLGKGHSISFWASYEADVRIRALCNLAPNDAVTNENVIKFIEENSRQFERTNMVHWTAGALNYTKKLIGHKLYEDSIENDAMENLYQVCVDDEFVELRQTYGDKTESLLKDIAWAKFNIIAAEYKTNKSIRNMVRDIQDSVVDKLAEQAPNVKQFSHALDEEQEKELEQELEEQRLVQRPRTVKPAVPTFDNRLEKLVLNGIVDSTIETMKSQRILISICESLAHTQLFRPYKKNKDAWADHLLVTKDFKTVIDGSSRSCDDFLRPVWWIARIQNARANDILLLLSSFECENLLPLFRKSTKATLFMYRPRLSRLHTNLLREVDLQVSGTDEMKSVDVKDEVQIGMYAGSMYFGSLEEQDEYCGFMGLIPLPRNSQQEAAFENGIIKSKGYVPIEYRRHPEAISMCVGHCKFQDNPVDLAIKLVEAQHQTLLKESHVAWILERGIRLNIENSNY